jgi:predicted unusual protein kinase regulating ubiquinone biosynthesis (AarF/ABC1/UbiB family)
MANLRDDERAVALAEELGGQLDRLKRAGPKLRQFLSMVQLDRASTVPAPGALPARAETVPFGRVRRVIEQDLEARLRDVFSDVDEEPLALASLGQVHRASTLDGEAVAIKVQHPGVAEAVDADLRNVGMFAPIMKRLAPAVDAGGLLAELRERISDELDYEVEAQYHRRIERAFRGHPHVRIPRVHTSLSTRRVLVTEFVEGVHADRIRGLGDAERDRIGETAFRFYFGLAWRDGVVAGDPHADNCILCPDGKLCLLDLALLRDLDAGHMQGERDVMRAVVDGDAESVHSGLSRLGYLPDPPSVPAEALLDFLRAAGEWMLASGFRRLDRDRIAQLLELGYPPRSPHFPLMRRLSMPPPTLLLRRMELQLAALLGAFRAGGDWAEIAAEHHSGRPPDSDQGRQERAWLERRAHP